MRHPNNYAPTLPKLPEGFVIKFFEEKRENDWADIQVSVGEFPTKEDALKCYEYYCQHMDELKKRQLFVVNEANNKAVATATAWYMEKGDEAIGVVHGLSCLPQYQAQGLGRIAATCMMDCFYRLMPNCPVWLDTQTWSYKAIGLYMDIGFVPLKTATFSDVPNEYDKALNAINGKMREDKLKQFIELAE